jgi:hypothetical protein
MSDIYKVTVEPRPQVAVQLTLFLLLRSTPIEKGKIGTLVLNRARVALWPKFTVNAPVAGLMMLSDIDIFAIEMDHKR